MKYPGFFLTFEGPEGCGKTTQSKRLIQHLEKLGVAATLTREPGGTRIGEKIRAVLLDSGNKEMVPLCEVLLYLAGRAQHVEEKILPVLQAGGVVICDRFMDATIAYQAYGRGLPLQRLKAMNSFSTAGLKPDLTLFLDVPVAAGLTKARNRKTRFSREGIGDRLEQESLAFHRRVYDGYRKLSRAEPRRFLWLRGTDSIEEIADKIWTILCARLRRRKIFS